MCGRRMFSEKEDLSLRLIVTARVGLGTGAHTDLLAAADLQNSALLWNSTNQGPKRVAIHQVVDSARKGTQKHSEGIGAQGE